MKTVMILAIVCMMCMLYGYDAIAGEWSQNLDAKPIELPLGLKFGEVYGGEIVSTRTNYMNGIESKSCHAVITNNWCGFEEIVIMMTGERRVDGVLGTKRDFKDFDEAITNLVALKEALSKKYGIRFMGDKAPKTIGDDEQLWSLTGIGADDENVSLRAAGIWRKKGEGNPTINLCLGIQSGLAAKIESKELEAEAAGLRSAIKEVFGVDFDTPQPKPLWGFDWEKLATPIEGLTEKRCNTA